MLVLSGLPTLFAKLVEARTFAERMFRVVTVGRLSEDESKEARAKQILAKPFSPSHTNQMLASLAQHGLIYKNRFGKYSFAVPLLGSFIIRTYEPPSELRLPV